MGRLFASILFLFSFFISVARSKTNQINISSTLQEKINAYLISALNAYHFNGVALVGKNGTPIFQKAMVGGI
jgi:hypothetical protein